ncbi:MAG TPA: tRNA pseudouridine(55) synthase TruB [Polyangia bacterium]
MVTDTVLVVDKPVGPTSFSVVRQIRHAAGVRRVGHGGTLDPLASGVLPICLGEATKLAPFLLGADKEYDVTIRLGVETDTDDADGTVTARHDAGAVSLAALQEALALFRGPISQVPPAFAAIKRDGRPLYDYARAGTPVEVAPRTVAIHALELTAFAGPDDLRLHVHCSKGTYVRALARDLGRALEVGAHVTALRRTRSGPFALTEARPLDEIIAALTGLPGPALSLVGLASALRHLPQVKVEEALARDLRAGKRVSWVVATQASAEPRVCLLDPAGDLITVAEPRPDGLVRTLRVFGSPRAKNPSEPANLR